MPATADREAAIVERRAAWRTLGGLRVLEASFEAPEDHAAEAARALFAALAATLGDHGLTLADLVRTRLWARDAAARDAASTVRRAALTGAARSASSSYVAADRFRGAGVVALDVVALDVAALGRARDLDGPVKRAIEHDPPRVPIRYLGVGPLVVLSGVTSELPTLAAQIGATTGRAAADLRDAGAGWRDVVQLGCFLRADQDAAAAASTVAAAAPGLACTVEVTPVGGFSAPTKLVELEVTALRPGDRPADGDDYDRAR